VRTVKIIKYLFTFIGLGMLGGAALLYGNTRDFLDTAARAEGVVVDLVQRRPGTGSHRYTYAPVVRYTTAAGETVEFVSRTFSTAPSHDRGERVTVLYDPARPREATMTGWFELWGGAAIVGGIGAAFLAFGVLFMVLDRGGRRKLRETGVPVTATITGVEQNTLLEVNGRHPWRITARWRDPATGTEHEFRSANLWQDPSPHLDGDAIRVYVERGNPRRYYMDVSFLPGEA